MDVSLGIASQRVREFLVQAYVRGSVSCGTAVNAELEGSTSVFTKVFEFYVPAALVENSRGA